MNLISDITKPFWVLAAIIVGSWVLRALIFRVLQRAVSRYQWFPPEFAFKKHFFPSFFFLLMGASSLVFLSSFPSPVLTPTFRNILEALTVICLAWTLSRVVSVFKIGLHHRLTFQSGLSGNNLRERRLQTQIQFIEKVLQVLVWIVGVSTALLAVDEAKQIGQSLLASAGLASVVLGFAAQKSISNLIAGFQIAFTQPLRLDDVVVVEGETGRIEEITLTYVVIRLWDLRRLIVPITYFTERTFQNWTRINSDLLTAVYLYADYSVPVEAMRAEFLRLLKGSPLWKGETALLQVTDMTGDTVQLRALMDVQSSADGFDLRCEIREKLIEFLQKNYPDSLPKKRFSGVSDLTS